jgi:GPH family glycoside/pentoside/hexuronide:cation symporter
MESNTVESKMRVSFWEKCAYGMGDMACNFFWMTFVYFGLFFYTDVFGIPAAIAGTMLFIVRIVDIIYDVFVGAMADRVKSKYGKFRPWILWFGIPFGVIGFLAFYTPDLAMSAKIVYAYITYTAMMLVYSSLNVPYGAMMAVMTPDSNERTSLSAYRAIFAQFGGLVVLLLTMILVKYFAAGHSGTETQAMQFGFSTVMGIYSALAIIMFMICFFNTRERVVSVSQENNKMLDDLKDLVTNLPWILLTCVAILTLIFVCVRSGAQIYYLKYYLVEAELFGIKMGYEVLMTVFGFIATGVAILGTMLLKPVAAIFGKRNTYIGAMGLSSVFCAAFFFIPANQIWTMLICQAAVNLFIGPSMAITWSMYADVADDSEVKTGRRATGLIYSSATMAQKFGWSIAAFVSGLFLAAFGFVANTELGPEALGGIKFLFSWAPIIGTALAIVALLFYKLDEKTVLENTAKLEAMKAEKEGK